MSASVHQLKPLRVNPHNADAEMGLLGAILMSNRCIDRVAGFLKPEHFYHPLHASIYETASKVIERGGVADPITLGRYFEGGQDFDEVGGDDDAGGYLAKLAGGVVSIVNAEHYGKIIYDCAMRRRLMDVAHDLLARAGSPDPTVVPEEVLAATENELFELAESGTLTSKPRKLIEFINGHLADIEEAQTAPGGVVGLSTGLIDLDAALRGLKAPDLIIVAGRPGMGKTALALNVAASVSQCNRQRGKTLFISEEMSGKQLAARLIADLTGIPVMDQFGKLEPTQMRQIGEAKERLRDADLWIEDTPSLSIAKVRSIARRHKRRHGLSLLIVDYLQLLNGGDARSGNRTEEVSIISGGLKAIAKELNVPVIALSQLNRSVESREDKRPMISDLRDGGSIEQDADVILFPFRLEYYLAKEEPMRRDNETAEKFAERRQQWFAMMEEHSGTADIIIAKFRQGATDSIRVGFDGPRTRFFNLARGGR